MTITNERLAEIKERVDKAFPGPWFTNESNDIVIENEGRLGTMIRGCDAEFITHARQDVEELVEACGTYKESAELLAEKLVAIHRICLQQGEKQNSDLLQIQKIVEGANS